MVKRIGAAVAAIGIVVASGIGMDVKKVWSSLDRRTVIEKINDHLVDLRAQRADAAQRAFALKSKAATAEAARAREAERASALEASCQRLADAIRSVGTNGTVAYGEHVLTIEQGKTQVLAWSRDARARRDEARAHEKARETYGAAVAQVGRALAVFDDAIAKLEIKSRELETTGEVLKVQDEVAAIMAGIRKVPGSNSATSSVLAEAEAEHDALRGRIEANGGVPAAYVDPEADQRSKADQAELARFGLEKE